MVSAQRGDEFTQARRSDGEELRGRHAAGMMLVAGRLETGAIAAQAGVHVEPEDDARRALVGPARARMTLEQEVSLRRPVTVAGGALAQAATRPARTAPTRSGPTSRARV